MSHSRQVSGEISSASTIRISVALVKPAALDLEVDELDAHAREQPREEVVDAHGKAHDVVELVRASPSRTR